MKLSYSRGFTLIELLVVISIIGMLSSVVLASVQTVRDRGRVAAGLVFERHIKGAFGDKILAEYNFDYTSGCPNGSADSSNIGTIPNVFGTSALNLSMGNPNNATCNNILSSDTPLNKGSSYKATQTTGGKIYLNGNGINTGTSFTKFSVGFWMKASTLEVHRQLQINTDQFEVTINFNTNNTSAVQGDLGVSPATYPNIIDLSQSTVIDNKWHYIYMGISSNGIQVFVDGKLNTNNTDNPPTLSSSNLINALEIDRPPGIQFFTQNPSAVLLFDNLILIGDAP